MMSPQNALAALPLVLLALALLLLAREYFKFWSDQRQYKRQEAHRRSPERFERQAKGLSTASLRAKAANFKSL